MQLDTLRDLLVEQLQDLYSAESQIIAALPKMMKKVTSSQLKQAFEMHLKETEKQKERLEQIFEIMGEKHGRHKCKAMEGLVMEAQELMKEDIDPEVLDAGLIAAAQRVEHYEIAVYGTARVYAKQIGEKEVERLLSETLEEEKNTDIKLTRIAEGSVNLKAEK